MQKSTFKLTKHELDFISDPIYMQMKQNLIRNFFDGMHGVGAWLMQKYYPNTSQNFKVTRGENYIDMPYVVLDVPQLKQQNIAGSLRIMFWWGHYISVQYFIRFDADKLKKLTNFSHKPYVISLAENLFNNNLDDAEFIPINNFKADEVTLPHLSKICCKIDLTELSNLEQHIGLFMDDMILVNEA